MAREPGCVPSIVRRVMDRRDMDEAGADYEGRAQEQGDQAGPKGDRAGGRLKRRRGRYDRGHRRGLRSVADRGLSSRQPIRQIVQAPAMTPRRKVLYSSRHERQSRDGFRLPPGARRGEEGRWCAQVFESVAPRYDLMNDLMSLGIHRGWKRDFITGLDPRPGRTLLDLAGGTGDISFGWRAARRRAGAAVRHQPRHARRGAGAGAAAPGRGHRVAGRRRRALPLPDGCVDRVSIAFGLRNCTDKPAVLREARRVLRPGGQFHCLEFSPRPGRRARAAVRRLVVPGAAAARPASSPATRTAINTSPRASAPSPTRRRWPAMMREAGFRGCATAT